MTTNDENKDQENKPVENVPQNQDKTDNTDNSLKPPQVDLKSNVVICDDSPLKKKDGQVKNHIIILENEKKNND